MKGRSHAVQMLGSLLVAAAVVVVAIVIVTSQFGSTSAAERELQENRLELQEELTRPAPAARV